MLEAAASQEASDDDTDLKEILDTARDHLNSSKFDDAEAAFLKLYQQIQVCIELKSDEYPLCLCLFCSSGIVSIMKPIKSSFYVQNLTHK